MTANAAPAPSQGATADRVRAERFRQSVGFMRTVKPLIIGSVLVWSYFLAVDGGTGPLVWAALVHGAQLLRFLALRSLTRMSPGDPGFEAAFRQRLIVPLALSGVTWGLAPWLMLQGLDPVQVAVMFIALQTMSTGAIGMLAYHWTALLVFVMPIQLGLLGRMLWLGEGGYVIAAIMLLYLAMLLRFGRRHHDLIGMALTARFENEALAARLEAKVGEIEHLSEEKTRFLAAASHDLRQPMHSLSLLCASLGRVQDDAHRQALLQSMSRSIDGLTASFAVMLDLSRLDAGLVTPRTRSVSVARMFGALQDQFAPHAAALGVDLRFHAGPWAVRIDPDLMLPALSNLIENALKYNRPGGRAHVGARRRGEQVLLQVRDSGIGIPAAYRERIFDEYFQLGNPERDRRKGLGMGLAIVKRLCAVQGVPVAVDSLPGQGTTMTIAVPRADRPPMPDDPVAPAPPRALPGHRTLSILVLDDEADVRHAMGELLRTQGHRCHLVGDAESAQAVLRRPDAAIDLLIADHRLRGGEDGIAAVRALRAASGRTLPALLITGDTAPERVRLAHESGIPVLFKPVRAESLLAALDAVVDGIDDAGGIAGADDVTDAAAAADPRASG